MNNSLVFVMLAAIIITYLTRYLPFAVLHNKKIPRRLEIFLRNLPVAVLSALAFQSVFLKDGEFHHGWDNFYLVGLVFAVVLAVTTRRLPVVVFGSISLLLIMNIIFT